ncbi:MAG TPA: hypothetical protein DCP10_00565 [Bacteroidales bacterium]|nr:hypothetical protein [Bacteroidales bacterium]
MFKVGYSTSSINSFGGVNFADSLIGNATICRNLYYFPIEFISRELDFIKPTFRLKKFIFRFMVVPSKWIKQGRGYVLKLFTTKNITWYLSKTG